MVQISPQNAAIASLIILVVVPVVTLAAVIAFPAAEMILPTFWIAILIGTLGLLLAHYWAAVIIWDTGKRAGAVVLLAGPVVVANLLASWVDGLIWAYLIGIIGFGPIITILVAGAALWVGSAVKRTPLRNIFIRAQIPPPPAPSRRFLGASALFLIGAIWMVLLLFF